jgi:biopolymer transport protein ExbB
MAAVRRWGRPSTDLERAVALAYKLESERLRRNVGTLRRIAALAPLLGILGTLFAAGRALEAIPPMPTGGAVRSGEPLSLPSVAWGPALAASLTPLSAGIVIATLALVAYDGLLTRIEKLAGLLDRLGAETIDAIALAAPIAVPTITLAKASARTPHQTLVRRVEATEDLPRSRPPES